MMNREQEGIIVIISAPSGSGKTTIARRLEEECPRVKRSVSYTTREPRKDEVRGKDYVFVTEQEFRSKIDDNTLLEWEENFGNYYGTAKEQVEETLARKQAIVLSIDVKGAKAVKDRYPEAISIFILPPSEEALLERLRNRRTDKAEQIDLRINEARREIEASGDYDYLIVNDDLDKAVGEVREIVETALGERS